MRRALFTIILLVLSILANSHTALGASKPIKLYSVYVKVTDSSYLQTSSASTEVPNVLVQLNAISSHSSRTTNTDSTGTAVFTNLQPGVYEAIVTDDAWSVGKTVLNVSGPSRVLTVGIDLGKPRSDPLLSERSWFADIIAHPFIIVRSAILMLIVVAGCTIFILKRSGKLEH
jgi:hypothetical protein